MTSVVIVVAVVAVVGVLCLAMARGGRAAPLAEWPARAPARTPARALEPEPWDDPEARPEPDVPWTDPEPEEVAA